MTDTENVLIMSLYISIFSNYPLPTVHLREGTTTSTRSDAGGVEIFTTASFYLND